MSERSRHNFEVNDNSCLTQILQLLQTLLSELSPFLHYPLSDLQYHAADNMLPQPSRFKLTLG